MTGRTTAGPITVGADGLDVPCDLGGTLDVRLDGRRVWSFTTARDGEAHADRSRVPWPPALAARLDGVADVELVVHVTGARVHRETVQFGTGRQRVQLTDADGNPLAVDKGGRLQRDFAHTSAADRGEIMDALEAVLLDLTRRCHLDAYLMYGCLLGAVRDGHLIGHDSDADVAYLSRHDHPLDVIGECTVAIRQMRALGWHVVRMSGANFKVWVSLPDGRRCGIDVFGSFHIGSRFHVTGSLTGVLDRSALLPFGTVTLEGRAIVAPARPEQVLAFTYGPSWRTPDPAFHFQHDPADVRRMNQWFRAGRRRLRHWEDFYKSPEARKVPREPSDFATWVENRLAARGGEPGRILDVGTGTGRDAAFFAGRGHRVVAQDFAWQGFDPTPPGRRTPRAEPRGREQGRVRRRQLNLESLRSTLVAGARFAHQNVPTDVYARGMVDALGPDGRGALWRFASMVQRRGGETFLEFRTAASCREPTFFPAHARTYLDPAAVVAEIETAGGHVVHRETGRDRARLGAENPEVCRLVVRWSA